MVNNAPTTLWGGVMTAEMLQVLKVGSLLTMAWGIGAAYFDSEEHALKVINAYFLIMGVFALLKV